ncbi:hypothetical protein ACWCQW_25820 [Streptomyces mirabilis]
MSLAGESGELLEVFQWLTPEQSSEVMEDPTRAVQVREEMADVFAYLRGRLRGVSFERHP